METFFNYQKKTVWGHWYKSYIAKQLVILLSISSGDEALENTLLLGLINDLADYITEDLVALFAKDTTVVYGVCAKSPRVTNNIPKWYIQSAVWVVQDKRAYIKRFQDKPNVA